MAGRSIWFDEEIDEHKVEKVAKAQNRSVSNLVNHLLKINYNVLKDKKKVRK